MKLPELKKNIHWTEVNVELSIEVLVRVKGAEGFHLAHYSYGLGEWFIQGFNGDWKVVEWWPLPEIGTGNK